MDFVKSLVTDEKGNVSSVRVIGLLLALPLVWLVIRQADQPTPERLKLIHEVGQWVSVILGSGQLGKALSSVLPKKDTKKEGDTPKEGTDK